MISRIFLDHPRSVEETYFEHLLFASRFSLQLMGAAFVALIHAILPCFFEKTASSVVARLYKKTRDRSSSAV